MHKILLNPGPTNTRYKTKEAQTNGSDVCHRTEEFKSILHQTKNLLLKRFGSSCGFKIALLGGSGTIGMEAMISSLVDEKVVVLNAGIYGQRAVDMLKIYGVEYTEVPVKDIRDVKPNEEYKCVYFVENETTTGEHFPLEILAQKYPNAKFFIDATSSFGASKYDDFLNRINAISFCSNKCLQSTPGLGIVIWDERLKCHGRSYYCDLSRYTSESIPFTLPVQSVYALYSTLEITSNHQECFNERRDKLILEFSKMGIESINYLPSNSIIGFKHPTMKYEQLRDFLYDRGLVIYAGVKGIENSFRVSTMSSIFDDKFNFIMEKFNETRIR